MRWVWGGYLRMSFDFFFPLFWASIFFFLAASIFSYQALRSAAVIFFRMFGGRGGAS